MAIDKSLRKSKRIPVVCSLKGTISQYGILQGHLDRETTERAAEADKKHL